MVLRYSNTKFLTVLDPVGLENIGWEAQVISPTDYATPLAYVPRFEEIMLSRVANDFGSGSIALSPDDPVLHDPLPLGLPGTILDRECLWQFYKDGVLRFEWLGEDTEEDVATEDGRRVTKIAGRTTEKVLEWGVASPGMVVKMVPDPKAKKPKNWNDEVLGPWVAPLIPTNVLDPMSFQDQPAIQAFRWLVLENVQPRGVIPFVDLLFSGTHDSEGQPWADVSDVVVEPGETPLDLLKRLSEALGWEFKMLPGFRLFISQTGFGQHREVEIKHFVGGSQQQHSRTGTTREIATAVFAQAQDGSIAQAIGASDASPHRREAWLEAGDAAGISGASRVANASLSTLKDRKIGRSVKVVDDQLTRIMFVDYDVQDWITVEDERYDAHAVKVLGGTVTVDSDAKVDLELTIQTKFEHRQVRVARMLNKLGASSASTGSSTPISTTQRLGATKLNDLADVNAVGVTETDILQWSGSQWNVRSPSQLVEDMNLTIPESIDDLTDVDTDTTPPTAGQALLWDDTPGLWVPGDLPEAPASIDDLTDVDTTTTPPTDGQSLVWDATPGVWVPGTVTGGGGGGGAETLPLDLPALHPTYGEEFTASSLPAKWTRQGAYVAGDEAYLPGGGLAIDNGRAAGNYYWQASPAGDFKIEMSGWFLGESCMWGIIVVDATGKGVGAGPYSGPTTGVLGALTGGAYGSVSFVPVSAVEFWQASHSGAPLWLRLVKSGATYTASYSLNGRRWSKPSAVYTPPAFTPARIGFGAFFGTPVTWGVQRFNVT